LPFCKDVPRLVRSIVVHGIKSGAPPDQREHFLLVYRNRASLKQLAGFTVADDA